MNGLKINRLDFIFAFVGTTIGNFLCQSTQQAIKISFFQSIALFILFLLAKN